MSEDIRTVARKRLKAKADFKVFLGIAILVALLLLGVWFFTGGPGTYFWPGWPIGGLTIAAAFSGYNAYGPSGHVTESAIDAEVERLKRRAGGA